MPSGERPSLLSNLFTTRNPSMFLKKAKENVKGTRGSMISSIIALTILATYWVLDHDLYSNNLQDLYFSTENIQALRN